MTEETECSRYSLLCSKLGKRIADNQLWAIRGHEEETA